MFYSKNVVLVIFGNVAPFVYKIKPFFLFKQANSPQDLRMFYEKNRNLMPRYVFRLTEFYYLGTHFFFKFNSVFYLFLLLMLFSIDRNVSAFVITGN